MTPVEIEFLMRDKLTPGVEKAGKSVNDLGKKAEDTSDAIKKKIEEQRKVIKQVESDIKSLEKEYEKLVPGRGKMEMAADLSGAKKALEEEKKILGSLSEKYKSVKDTQTTYMIQMRKIREEMTSLANADGTVSGANLQRYNELKTKLSEVGIAYRRVRQEQKLLTTEGSAQLAGVMSGISGIAGAFSAAQGVSSLFVKDNEKLAAVQTRLQAVMAITIGLQQTATTLTATSAFRTQTLTKAKNLLTTANTRLATSLGVSTIAAKALMGTLTLGLSVAITGLIWAWDKYSDAQEKAAEKRKILLETEKEGRAMMVKTRFEIDTTLKSLKDFVGTKEEEKKKINELNSKYGESFGHYNTIAEWYDVLLEKGDAYIQMLFLQAKAQNLVNKAVEADEKVNEIKNTSPNKVEGSMGGFARMGLMMAQGESHGQFDAMKAIAEHNKEAHKQAVKDAEELRDSYLEEARKLEEERSKIAKDLGGSNRPTYTPATKESTLTDLENKARKKIEDNTIALMKEGYERQRKEAELAFEREKERITNEEKQRLELYEKLRKAGEPVTKEQKDSITSQSAEQVSQAKDIFDQTLAKINTKEKLELNEQDKVIKEALIKYRTYYQERLATITKFKNDREALEKGGATQGQFSELDYQQEQALSAIDEKFAMREDSFQSWANSIVSLSLEKLTYLLGEAEKELSNVVVENPNDPRLASLRTMVAKYKQEIQKQNTKTDTAPKDDSIKRWQNLQKVLGRCSREFSALGKEVGGTTGEILSSAGEIATSSLSMISSITELANWSITATKMTAEGVSKSMQAVEKASVILAVISTAIQLMQQLQSLIPDAHEEYLNYAAKVNEINIMRDAVQEYELAVLKAKQAEESWFAVNNLSSLRQAQKMNEKILGAYITKASESQAIYQNQSGGGWLTGALNSIMGNMSWLSWWDDWRDIWGVGGYDKGMTAAIDNLRVETRKKSSGFLGSGIGGKSQKTEDLQTWINNNKDLFNGLDTQLFDERGLINKELAESILNNHSEKLVGQTQETLKALVELREQYDEYLKTLHEYVSSLYEPLVDNFVSSLWDWFDEGKDALSSFKEYASQTFRDIASDMMRTVVLKNVFGEGENSFQEQLNKLYEDYASGSIKTEAELMQAVSSLTAGLIGKYESVMPDLKNIMEVITESLANAGIDLRDTEAYTQSGRAGYQVNMSQDTGNRLEGIGTSIQMHISNMDDTVENINVALGNALGALQKIEENTAYSGKMLSEIKAYIERILNEGIETR